MGGRAWKREVAIVIVREEVGARKGTEIKSETRKKRSLSVSAGRVKENAGTHSQRASE